VVLLGTERPLRHDLRQGVQHVRQLHRLWSGQRLGARQQLLHRLEVDAAIVVVVVVVVVYQRGRPLILLLSHHATLVG
jgi:hypothetical protein